MASISSDKSLSKPIDQLNALRVAPPRIDSSSLFDSLLQLAAPSPPPPPREPEPLGRSTSDDSHTTRKEIKEKEKSTESKKDEKQDVESDSKTNAPPQACAPPPELQPATKPADPCPLPNPDAVATDDKAIDPNNVATPVASVEQSAEPVVAAAPTLKGDTRNVVLAKPAAVQPEVAAPSDEPVSPQANVAPEQQPKVEAVQPKQGPVRDPKQEQSETEAPKAIDITLIRTNAPAEKPAEPEATSKDGATEDAPAKKTVAASGPKKASNKNVNVEASDPGPAPPTQPDRQSVAPVAAADAVPEQTITASDAQAKSGASADPAPIATASSKPDAVIASVAPGTPAAKSVTGASGAQSTSRSSSSTSEVDRVRFVQRVSRALQTAGNENGSLKLRLSPPELGSVRVEVFIKDGLMSARLEAETPAAKAALLDNFTDLRTRLAEHDIKLDRFEVHLADPTNDGGRMSQNAGGDSSAWQGFDSPGPRGRQPQQMLAAKTEVSTAESSAAIVGSDQLNVVV